MKLIQLELWMMYRSHWLSMNSEIVIQFLGARKPLIEENLGETIGQLMRYCGTFTNRFSYLFRSPFPGSEILKGIGHSGLRYHDLPFSQYIALPRDG